MALKDFISIIQNVDVARSNRFMVEIQPPETFGLQPQQQVNLLCQDVNFPGQNIRTSTDDLRQGPTREIGQAVTYGDITMTFICTAGLPEKLFFEAWQKLMFNSVTWQAKYYRDYIGEIKLKELDRADRVRYGVILYEAYPKIINAQDYSNTSSDTIQTLQVQFVYHHWKTDTSIDTTDAYSATLPAAAMGDDFSAFSGGRGAAETRAVDDFSGMKKSQMKSSTRNAKSRAAAAADTRQANQKYTAGGFDPR
jgi:hypothetical protein